MNQITIFRSLNLVYTIFYRGKIDKYLLKINKKHIGLNIKKITMFY